MLAVVLVFTNVHRAFQKKRPALINVAHLIGAPVLFKQSRDFKGLSSVARLVFHKRIAQNKK